ncbi:hypothetical protein D6D21_01022 [Aureobasidium pullulans]|uniref:DNA replication ATP-dependent helicase/nuclease n=1 Tax=Aureobasidium pullulans TaxID=5580 RepID=A0AB74JA54_AURPU|nr:hypothetical protein D6D21_01022 [Aureobasidium pullulans]
MSSRQKSFFEQDHGSKSKARWQGNRSFDRKPSMNEATSKPAPPPKPPIQPSTETRSKLKAFEFARHPDKENDTSTTAPASPVKQLEAPSSPIKTVQDRPLPSTPAMRLPLADLIGNAEDALRRPTPQEESPVEEIGWIANSSHPDLTPRQRRRRPQSSSPVSSSQNDVADLPDANLPLSAFKTPKADPAAELWTRYATARNPDDTPIEKRIPLFAHLMNDSSPRSAPRTPGGSVGGLRRWASCGLEFPSSRVKRRRVNGIFRDNNNNNTDPGDLSAAKPLSRVGMLVEKVQESLAHKDLPSSSSPLPDKGEFPSVHMATSDHQQSQPRSARSSQQYSYQHEDTEFDDADITLDDIADIQPTAAVQNNSMSNTTIMNTIDEDDDEFGDDEFGDDLDVDEIENAVSFFESRPGTSNGQFTSQPNTCAIAQSHPPLPPSAPPPQQQQQQQQPQTFDLTGFSDDDDDDEFGGSDLDEEQFAQAEMAATQALEASTSASSTTQKSRAIQRYLVKQVIDGQYTDLRGRQQPEKVLFVEDEVQKRNKAITLRQSWLETHCAPGSYVHVVGHFNKSAQITIDDAENLIIVHPDHLISATVVADSFECIRRAVLQDRVKATSRSSEPSVYGSMLHEIFQEAMKSNDWDQDSLNDLVGKTVGKYLESLFELGHEDTNKAFEHLKSKMPEMSSWAKVFVKAKPGPDALAEDRGGKKIRVSITKLLDVEEHVWSPTYGLKGNIDATVQVRMEDEQGQRALTVPFEVKTGRNTTNTSHRAQTALYTLLLSDRYDLDVIYGLLYYMENSSVTRIPAIRHELRHMIMQRNELACYVRERLQLPPMIQDERKCGRCYAKTECFLYHKLAEDGTAESAGVKEKFNDLVGKLQPIHQDFFKKWDNLLTKEESELMKFRRELWTMLSTEREKLGRCFSEVVIEKGSMKELNDMTKINRYRYTLIKRKPPPGFSFTESQITIGEPIVISSEKGHFALANGYVTKLSKGRITVAVDRRLHNARQKQADFDANTNQTFSGIMEVGREDEPSQNAQGVEETPIIYRLDKDEFSNGMATVRNNLLALMDDNVFRSAELRKLIVENTDPEFKTEPAAYALSGPASQLQINKDQRAAIDKVMSAKDYALVLGMPGTGKTTTIAHIIRALVARGKSVLLTSYTHTAVDNILLKLRDSDASILRLGTLAKIHPEVQEFAHLAATPKQSMEELEDTYMKPQVVATTCLGVNHQLFQRRAFDYCIVDEASQITLPVCLGPIRMAKTFVLVGDHYQLPPLVQNREAQEGGLDISLFKLLSDRHPESVVNLEHQYRMCEEVQLLSKTLIYSGRLKCGNEAVATRTLRIPSPDGLMKYHSEPQGSWSVDRNLCLGPAQSNCWISDLLSPQRKVVFANTDTLCPVPKETVMGSRIVNAVEATLLVQLVLSLIAQGISPTEIGVITFYRSQLALLRQLLKPYPEASGVEMHTADKFQGRDKEVVFISCVRSNDTGNVGDLLRDWRRINVAFTRARSKMVILGSKETLSANELLEKFLKLVDSKGWIYNLPKLAERGHNFQDTIGASLATQKTPAKTPAKKRDVEGDEEEGATEAKKRRRHHNPHAQRKGIEDFLCGSAEKTVYHNENSKMNKPFKVPEKVGKIGTKALFGKSQASGKRPVLMDIVNDALGGLE